MFLNCYVRTMHAVFLDTETSGLNAMTHCIFELAYKIVDVRTGEVKSEYQSLIAQPREVWEQSDKESLRITGFSWEEVSSGKKKEVVAAEVKADFQRHNIVKKKAVFICQNPTFDRAFFSQVVSPEMQEQLQWPYHWLDLASMYWALSVREAQQGKGPTPWEGGISKDNIAKRYGLEHEPKPHRAMNGVVHLMKCYETVVGFF